METNGYRRMSVYGVGSGSFCTHYSAFITLHSSLCMCYAAFVTLHALLCILHSSLETSGLVKSQP